MDQEQLVSGDGEEPGDSDRGGRFASARLALLGVVFVLLALDAVWLWQVPRVGVADNGDFWRVALSAGLTGPPEAKLDGRFVQPFYVAAEHAIPPATSPAVVAGVARFLWGSTPFDIRRMGVFYLAILALILALSHLAGCSTLTILVVAFVLSDSGYLLFFNSFYADPAMLLGVSGVVLSLESVSRPRSLAASSGIAVRRAARTSLLIGSVLLAGLSKVQYASLPALVFLTVGLASLLERRLDRRRVLLGALVLLAFVSPLWFVHGPGPHFPEVNKYNAVFSGVAVMAAAPDDRLVELGVPEHLRGLPRSDVFSAGLSLDHEIFGVLAGIPHWKIAALYLGHPAMLFAAAREIVRQLALPRSHQRGTTERWPGLRRPMYVQRGWEWGAVVEPPLRSPGSIVVVLGAGAGLALAGLARTRRRRQELDVALLLLGCWVGLQGCTAIMGDGTASLRQHLLGARFALDLLALMIVSRGFQWLSRRVAGPGGEVPAGVAKAPTE